MPFTKKKLIEEIYNDKAFSILRVPIKLSYYLAFCYVDFLSILKLLKSDNIIISSIELYKKQTYEFIPPNFWYHWDDLNECYILIEDFLWTLINCDSVYYTLDISTNNSETLELKWILDKIANEKTPLSSTK